MNPRSDWSMGNDVITFIQQILYFSIVSTHRHRHTHLCVCGDGYLHRSVLTTTQLCIGRTRRNIATHAKFTKNDFFLHHFRHFILSLSESIEKGILNLIVVATTSKQSTGNSTMLENTFFVCAKFKLFREISCAKHRHRQCRTVGSSYVTQNYTDSARKTTK